MHITPKFKISLWHVKGNIFSRCCLKACRFSYVTGVQTVRILKRMGRHCFVFFRPVGYLLRHIYETLLGRRLRLLAGEAQEILVLLTNSRKRAKRATRRSVGLAFRVFFHSLRGSMVLHRQFVIGVLNVVTPVLCVFALFLTAQHWNYLNFGLSLSNRGTQIAYISSEKTYEDATELMNQRMIHDTSDGDEVKYAPNFQLVAGNVDYLTPDSVCDLLIRQSNGIIEEASGLYVNGELKGAVKSSADLRYMLQNQLDIAKNDEEDATARFTQNIQIVSGLYPTDSIITTDAMQRFISGSTSSLTTYTVQDGDTVSSLADSFGMSPDALRNLNNITGDALNQGDLLRVTKTEPNLTIELIRKVTYESVIPYTTITQLDDTQYTDYTVVLTEGSDGMQTCVDIVHTINGSETQREVYSRTVTKEVVNKVVLTGTKKRPQFEKGIASGTLTWPVPALHTITTYFEYRWGSFHTGIDISGSSAYGCTIVAADGGVVSLSGWNDGYGECIIINHENGMKTLYGHCSSLLVSEGEAVAKGQAIARVGSTGYSTGAHCHFEVIVNGTYQNPLNYVS